MAAPLRYPLILLAWGAMAAIYLPLLPAAGELVGGIHRGNRYGG
ncbi:hypothetical protein, partial [Klebsiella pneumoniae]